MPGNGYQPPFQSLPSGCCSNTAGRLAAVQFVNSNPSATQNGYDVQQLFYLYSYNQAGRVTIQDLRLTGAGGTSPRDLYANYTWDNMGRMTAQTYPLSGPQVAMSYDAMSNLSSETQAPCQSQDQTGNCQTYGSSAPLASATYNFAGQLSTLNYPGGFGQETRGYNSMMQLTSIASSQINMTYNYSATQNNGRIASSADAVTGENVSYTYDSLNRLIAAASTGVKWSESYSYDGFGNMTGKTSTMGTGANPQVDPYTNRARMINDYGFDANGNWLGVPGPLGNNLINTWNVENQLVSNGMVDSVGNPFTYTYDPGGKRVLQYSVSAKGYGPWGTLYFYGITGQRLGIYHLYYVTDIPTTVSVKMYFGGRLLAPVDRLGSVRGPNGPAYFPWGEEESPTTPNGTDKYATYFRDGVINGAGEDYANARYYNNNFGRFWSPDPSGAKVANPRNPTSWNKYTYAGGDPVNFVDPSGRCTAADSSTTCWADDGYLYHLIVQETNGGRGGALSSLCTMDGDPVPCMMITSDGYLRVPSGMDPLTPGLPQALSALYSGECLGNLFGMTVEQMASLLSSVNVITKSGPNPDDPHIFAEEFDPNESGNPVPGQYAIVLYPAAPGYNVGAEAANTIVHELVHVAFAMGYSVNSAWTQLDGQSDTGEVTNNNLVVNNCGVGSPEQMPPAGP